ncbi:hypothetical protein Q3G72_024842 [Acer saccharum]|nr:hypothetical protein Q3G72_024842 [Acer saccharum]
MTFLPLLKPAAAFQPSSRGAPASSVVHRPSFVVQPPAASSSFQRPAAVASRSSVVYAVGSRSSVAYAVV